MDVTFMDVVVFTIITFSSILAMLRGFSRGIFSIFSWILAALGAYFFHDQLLPYVVPYITHSSLALFTSCAIIFIVIFLFTSFLTMRLSSLVLQSSVGPVDRLLGFIFGIARGIIICAVGTVLVTNMIQQKKRPEWLIKSASAPTLFQVGDKFLKLFPQNAIDLIDHMKAEPEKITSKAKD